MAGLDGQFSAMANSPDPTYSFSAISVSLLHLLNPLRLRGRLELVREEPDPPRSLLRNDYLAQRRRGPGEKNIYVRPFSIFPYPPTLR